MIQGLFDYCITNKNFAVKKDSANINKWQGQ